MKKLMLVVAIVMMAIASQAAIPNWKWSCANFYDGKGTDSSSFVDGATAYIFDSAKITQQTVFDNFGTANWLSSNCLDTKTVSEGRIAAASSDIDFAYGVAGEDIYFFFAVADGDKVFISNTKKGNGTVLAGATGLSFGTLIANGSDSKALPTNGFVSGGRWAAVPEPTSALLMLLGMAGLAIRRRRA